MRKVGFVVVTGVAALGLWLGMAMRNCGYPHQYPHYPHILRYIRHMSDNADIHTDAHQQIYLHENRKLFNNFIRVNLSPLLLPEF